ncbi:MAG TPA: prepilin-type N-terminal cleavage/methylation domain-containing protein [Planctomycetota bacterium]|nr:prepilin-type N-terminal cleavage/methylation domain-containing protein [Planctomycetota bacterium]
MRRATGPAAKRGYTILELLVSISALALGLVAAYAAQLSAGALARDARENDLATFAANAALEGTTARPFAEMMDPDPIVGSVDTTELAAFQPPYDPRGFNTYKALPATYPDAPTVDYTTSNPAIYNKILLYGARIWEPVAAPVTKTDPATGVSYKLYPMGELQKPKVLVWFEPRPTLEDGGAGAYHSTIAKKNALGFWRLFPQMTDPTDEATALPCTVVTAIGWFPTRVDHTAAVAATFNPFDMFVAPADGSNTFTVGETATLKTNRDKLKAKGMRFQVQRTVVKQ